MGKEGRRVMGENDVGARTDGPHSRGRKGWRAFLTCQDMRDANAAPWSHAKDTGFKDLGRYLNSVWLRAPGKLIQHLGQH